MSDGNIQSVLEELDHDALCEMLLEVICLG